jgi:catechol 2,3-dioxygenase-like lactoylglutathione lyase family enzyme
MIVGVQDVYYNVQDLPRAIRFYRDVLKLRLLHENQYWASLDVGGSGCVGQRFTHPVLVS